MTIHRAPTVLGPFGRFVIERRLGEGQAALVYQARDRDTGEHVALKLFKHEASDSTALARFEREFSTLKSVRHDSIVRLHDLYLDDEEDGESFFTMELVAGVDLVSYVRRDVAKQGGQPAALLLGQPMHDAGSSNYAPCTPEGLVRLRAAFQKLVTGVSAIHAAGLVHRDLRPDNVRVTREERVVILDFGLATHSGVTGAAHDLVGTPAYMAPEQWESDASGPPSDWYAVGVMLFEALTGGAPFSGNAHEVFVRKRTVGAPPPGLLVPGVPDDLDRLCSALLRTSAEARPAVGEILASLSR